MNVAKTQPKVEKNVSRETLSNTTWSLVQDVATSEIKANGKMIVIDGGFSKAYQSTTGTAGYTLLYNSYGMQLVAHQKFNSKEEVLSNGTDVLSVKRLVDEELERKKVRETNIGDKLSQEIANLNSLRKHRYME